MSSILEGTQENANLSSSWAEQSEIHGYRIEKLNSLAFSKGVRPKCELTGTSATVQMVTPFITLFFNSKENAVLSWTGIMHKIVPFLGPIRSQPAITGSEEERARRQKTLHLSKKNLRIISKGEGVPLSTGDLCHIFKQNPHRELLL